jgi:major type 1 subunit fimbrin (pilin)
MNKLIWSVRITGIIVIFSLAGQCWAGCTVAQPVIATAGGIPTILSIKGHPAPGTLIGNEISVPNSDKARSFSCTESSVSTYLRLNPSWSPSVITDVYNTSIPGIGVKISEQSTYGNISALTTVPQHWYVVSDPISPASVAYVLGIKVQFYITGTVTPGVYPPETLIEAWMNSIDSTVGGANYVTLKTPEITVKTFTCVTPNIIVNLGKYKNTDFSGINTKSTAKSFNFEIKNCDPGLNSVNYTFKPAAGISIQQSGTINQYITLDASSTASGVGIQVYIMMVRSSHLTAK